MTDDQQERRRIGATEYVAPILNRHAFHCPHCSVFAQQQWSFLIYDSPSGGGQTGSNIYRGECFNCHQPTYWWHSSTNVTREEFTTALMVIPTGSASAPPPHPDFPPAAKAHYDEARSIVDRSPRGATALLRLTVETLCGELGETGKLNEAIGSLVAKGLQPGVQQALDALRVIGNKAVHPGQIDTADDADTAVALFGLLNFIVEQMITRHKELQGIYDTLPQTALAAIQRRDAGSEE